MKTITIFSLSLLLFISSCSKDDATVEPTSPETMYFPPNTNPTWETKSISSLNWNQNAIQPLKDFLIQKNTKSFMILVNGRIVMEEYFNGHTSTDTWQWNSAGKTLVGTTTGIAQQEGLLDYNTKVSHYLGEGWTNTPLAKENLINSKHLLTMTSGLNDQNQLVIPSNLTYLADAGTRIGMDGFWNNGVIFKIYHSNTRSMARFGLLALNKGKWNNEVIINETFFNESINSSQSINPSYGYFWWLNGKTSSMIPGGQEVYPGSLVSNAPADMYAAMGASDQRIYVIPSKKMVVIRMGDASDPSNPNFAVSGFDNELWSKINAVIN